jgi:6,7-dimethyl-8-ribityllumazine synthase
MRSQSPKSLPKDIDPSWRIGIVHSSYYKEETDALISAAEDTLIRAGVSKEGITCHEVPGSFEIPLIGAALIESESVDALIGIGVVIEGETNHAHLIAEQAARGIMDIQIRYGVPFAFEILFVKNKKQAKDRACDTCNKGEEASIAVLHSLAELNAIRS